MEDTPVDNTDSDIEEGASAPVPLPDASGELGRESLHGLWELFVFAFASSLREEWDSEALVTFRHFPPPLLLHARCSLVVAVSAKNMMMHGAV